MKNLIPTLICLFLVIPCQARVITVDDDGPADFNNIQAAINDSNDGDTVIVAPGPYTGPGNRDIDFFGKAITVRSTDPNDPNIVAATIIDCNGTETELHNGFRFLSGEDANCVLSGFTIINGYVFSYWGGCGGGILCYQSSPTIINCIISGNYAVFGGGMYNAGGSPTVINCIFSGNSADMDGGGGGGMYNNESNPTLTNCIISGNKADWYGGGMSNYDNSSPTVINCIFSGNSANLDGGGMYNDESNPTLTNCIFSGNSAGRYGGGIHSYRGSNPTLSNCILWGNTATHGDEICLFYRQAQPSAITVSYSDVQGGAAGVYIETGSTLNWEVGNIDADPCFVEPGYWVDANDPNIIVEPNDPNAVWVDGDYHLKSEGWRWDTKRKVWTWDDVTSRCIDAGNPGSPLREELLSVPDDPNNEWGQNLRINMGAYGGTAEASMPPYDWALLADLTNDGKVNLNDLAAFVDYWLDGGECIPSDLNRNQFVDFADFALLGQDWFLETSWYAP